MSSNSPQDNGFHSSDEPSPNPETLIEYRLVTGDLDDVGPTLQDLTYEALIVLDPDLENTAYRPGLRWFWRTPHFRLQIQAHQDRMRWTYPRRATLTHLLENPDTPATLYIAQDPSEIENVAVNWLGWPGVLALGEVTALIGLPNVGKSTLARLIAAEVAKGRRGTLPSLLKQQQNRPAHSFKQDARVLWVTAEESISQTLKPGLEAAGMPPGRWRYVDARNTGRNFGPLYLDQDGLERLKYTAAQDGMSLVILDGSDAFIPPGMSPNKGEDVRRMMGALSEWAASANLAILIFRHEGKTVRQAGIEAGTGSIQWAASVRLAFLMSREKKGDPTSPVSLAPVKDNLAPVRSIQVRIESRLVPVRLDNMTIDQPFGRAVLGSPGDLTADDLTRQPCGESDGGTRLDDAKAFFQDVLSEGPVLIKTVKEAAQGNDISLTTLRRAREELGILTVKQQQDGVAVNRWPYAWKLPEQG